MVEENGDVSKVRPRLVGNIRHTPIQRILGKIGESYQRGKKDPQSLGDQYPVPAQPNEGPSR